MADYYDDIYMRNLKISETVKDSDFITGETELGTRLFPVKSIRNMIYSQLMFENINQMKNTKFREGDIIITNGYRTIGDGGGSVYYVAYDPTAVSDNGLIHDINSDNTLRAKMITMNNEVNIHHFGAYGDGLHDDTKFIQNAIDTGLSVKFTSGKIYKITSPIRIKKSNQVINMNNGMIVPYNCTAFMIDGEEDAYIQNITFTNVNIRCSNSGSGFLISKYTKNINIDNFIINGVSSNNHAFNIDSCERLNVCNGYVINKDYNGNVFVMKSTDTENKNRSIYIKDVQSFNADNFVKIDFSDETTNIVVENSSLVNDDLSVDNLSTAFYVHGSCNQLSIRNFTSTNVNKFLYTSSEASCDIDVDNLNVYDNRSLYDLNSMAVKNHVYLKGIHDYHGVAKEPKNEIITNMLSNLHINTDIIYDEYSFTAIGEKAILTGKLFDNHIIDLIDEKHINLKTSTTLRVEHITHARYDWTGDLVLKNIEGFEGQMISVRSTTQQEISSGGNIILYPDEPEKSFKEPMSSIPYKFVCKSGKWIKIS